MNFLWEDAPSLFTFYFFSTAKLVRDGTDSPGREETLQFSFFPLSYFEITRKVLLHQMLGVKCLAHLPFPIYIALVISRLVHSDSRLKLYLIYLADQLHIQANHLLTVEMYLN